MEIWKLKIWKYELEIVDYQTIKVGDMGATILSVAEQNGKLMMWVMVDEDKAKTGKHSIGVHVIGTGNPVSNPYSCFVGTVVMPYGLVWHVFVDYEKARIVDAYKK